MMDEFIRLIAEQTKEEKYDPEPPWMAWKQARRIKEVARFCAERWTGDFVEIGCYTGVTTRNLGIVTREHGRRIIAVDPWEDDTAIYDDFMQRTSEYSDLIDAIRLSSQDEKAIEQIKARTLCFAFIDGLHEYEALACDIRTVGHCVGIIAVDDVSWRPADLRLAFWEGAKALRRELYWHPKCREGYLLPC